MHDCIYDVHSWFLNNELKMNSDKTLFINIKIGSSDIEVVESVTNLGVKLYR